MGIPTSVAPCFAPNDKERYLKLLQEFGSHIDFEEDLWLCDHLKRYPYINPNDYRIYFVNIPASFKETVKYYSIFRLQQGLAIGSIGHTLTALSTFCVFLQTMDIQSFEFVNTHTAALFQRYLDTQTYAAATKNGIWCDLSKFFASMGDFNGQKLKNPFRNNPFPVDKKHDEKYIPVCVVEQLDRIFYDQDICLETRVVYWLLRLIPSRINEVLSMKIECLKRYQDHYVIFIPTWKQNGGHQTPIMRSIHIENEGIGAYLIDLIRCQQQVATALQPDMTEDKREALFTYRRLARCADGTAVPTKRCYVLSWNAFNFRLKDVCQRFHVHDERGKPYVATSHQLRHNGITDRLAAGFTIEQVAEMTGHHGAAMIWNSYAHFDALPQTTQTKQRELLREPAANPYVLFGGRILNMEPDFEQRLLTNLRAHRVQGGICSDIAHCQSDMWNCLACDKFIPDKEQMRYYQEQIHAWQDKVERFSAFPQIRQYATRNAALFQSVVDKMNQEVIQDE